MGFEAVILRAGQRVPLNSPPFSIEESLDPSAPITHSIREVNQLASDIARKRVWCSLW